jgi:hypothetical protein
MTEVMAFFVFYWENFCKYCTFIVSPWQKYRKLQVQSAVLGATALHVITTFFLAYGEMAIEDNIRHRTKG